MTVSADSIFPYPCEATVIDAKRVDLGVSEPRQSRGQILGHLVTANR
jgi:hypothetical protein